MAKKNSRLIPQNKRLTADDIPVEEIVDILRGMPCDFSDGDVLVADPEEDAFFAELYSPEREREIEDLNRELREHSLKNGARGSGARG